MTQRAGAAAHLTCTELRVEHGRISLAVDLFERSLVGVTTYVLKKGVDGSRIATLDLPAGRSRLILL
jgi:hypothetical protein